MAGNETAGVQVIGQECRQFAAVIVQPAQQVTGIVVNDALRVPREDRRRFRAVLANCRRLGVASQANGNPRFREYLRGFASYVHMVHPEEGVELLRQVAELVAYVRSQFAPGKPAWGGVEASVARLRSASP